MKWRLPSDDDPEAIRAIEEEEAARLAFEEGLTPEGRRRWEAGLHVDEAPPLPPPPMPTSPEPVEVPNRALLVSREQAAILLGVSLDSFERHVTPQIRIAPVGRRQMVPVAELHEFVNRIARRALS